MKSRIASAQQDHGKASLQGSLKGGHFRSNRSKSSDTRPSGTAQRSLKTIIDHSPKVRQMAQQQVAIDQSPRVVAQSQTLQAFSSQPSQPTIGRTNPKLHPIQRVIAFSDETEYLDISKNVIPLGSYEKVQKEAQAQGPKAEVIEGDTGSATAKYSPAGYTPEAGGTIRVKVLAPEAKVSKNTKDYHNRLIGVAHETRHFVDDAEGTLNIRGTKKDQIFTEWRAFATQSAVVSQLIALGKTSGTDFSSRYLEDKKGFETFFWKADEKTAFLNKAWRYGDEILRLHRNGCSGSVMGMLLSSSFPGFTPPNYEGYEDIPKDELSADHRAHKNPTVPFVSDVSGMPKDRTRIEGITDSYIAQYGLDTTAQTFISENLPQLREAVALKTALESEASSWEIFVGIVSRYFAQDHPVPKGPIIDDVD